MTAILKLSQMAGELIASRTSLCWGVDVDVRWAVGFYLWFDRDLAWAQGTYEYRPMGTAVISTSDLFSRRDFDPRRVPALTGQACLAGHFASLGHLNGQMWKERQRGRRLEVTRPASG